MIEKKNLYLLGQEMAKLFHDIRLIKVELYKYQKNILKILFVIIEKYKIIENNKFRTDIFKIIELTIKYKENGEDLSKIIKNKKFELLKKVLNTYANIQIKLMDFSINISKRLLNVNILSKEEYKEIYSNLKIFINKKNELKKYIDSDKFKIFTKDFNNLVKIDKHPALIYINMVIKYVPYMFICEETNIIDTISKAKY
jgi:hypothetical protein